MDKSHKANKEKNKGRKHVHEDESEFSESNFSDSEDDFSLSGILDESSSESEMDEKDQKNVQPPP